MQLGARWRTGDPPHRSVPAALHPLIAQQEAEHPGAHSWTLTFLEGRPRCELDHLVVVGLDAAGVAKVLTESEDDDDDWLR